MHAIPPFDKQKSVREDVVRVCARYINTPVPLTTTAEEGRDDSPARCTPICLYTIFLHRTNGAIKGKRSLLAGCRAHHELTIRPTSMGLEEKKMEQMWDEDSGDE